jgi:uncharacterized protein (DUF2252 family)
MGARVAYLAPSERAARGKAARKAAPRRSHAEWEPSPARPHPVAVLEQQAEARVPELVPIRYGRMLVSPFTFFRGGAAIMASDLAGTPESGFHAQLCGDAHLSNFGVFGSPERKFLFDINDFDETHPGPWEWDVKRLAASVAVAARECGFSRSEREEMVVATVREYRTTIRALADAPSLRVWHSQLEVRKLMARMRREFTAKRLAQVDADLAKARTKDSMRALSKLTGVVEG